MAKVSIVMGIYNCEATLPSAIDSVVCQTYEDWELIMCDDGSHDNTYKIALKYKEQFPEKIIVLKNKKNLRLAATLNRCLEYSTGEYIARMDADDISLPDRIKMEVEFLENNPNYDVVGCAAKIYDGKNVNGTRVCKEIPTSNDVLLGPPFIHPTILIRSKVIKKLGGYTVASRTMRGQDWDLWFRFYAAGYRGYNLKQPLFMYHETSEDYKKRTLKSAIGCSKTAFRGCRILNVSPVKYLFALKPIISWFIPEKIKKRKRKEF